MAMKFESLALTLKVWKFGIESMKFGIDFVNAVVVGVV